MSLISTSGEEMINVKEIIESEEFISLEFERIYPEYDVPDYDEYDGFQDDGDIKTTEKGELILVEKEPKAIKKETEQKQETKPVVKTPYMPAKEIQRRIDEEPEFLCYDESRALKVSNDGMAKKYRIECGLTECICGCGTLILDTNKFVIGHHKRREILISLNKYEETRKNDAREHTNEIIQEYQQGIYIDTLAKKYNCSYPLIKDILLENNVVLKRKPRQPLSDEQKANIAEGMMHSRYFTLKKRGVTSKSWMKKKEFIPEPKICVDDKLVDVSKIIAGFSLPSEFLETPTVETLLYHEKFPVKRYARGENTLHKIIRLWCIALQTEDSADIEFFYKVKRCRRPVDIVISDNGSSKAFEIELLDKDLLSFWINLLQKKKFFKNLTVVFPKYAFISKQNVKKIQRLPSFLNEFDISTKISPFSYDSADFSRDIYEKIVFSR